VGFIPGESFGEIRTDSLPDIFCLAYINQFILIVEIFIYPRIGR